MLQFITNKDKSNHAGNISQLLANADGVYIMVAFLKNSGLRKLLPYVKKETEFKILAGVNFGLTDPTALSTLLTLSDQSNQIAGYLTRLDSKQVFHPKMYLFKSGIQGHIIIGSANLTQGGLVNNNECSLSYRCETSDQIWKDAYEFFQQSISPTYADQLNSRIIAIYRGFYEKQKKINEKSQQFANVQNNDFYDLEKLKSHYKGMDQDRIKKELSIKEGFYKEAKETLDLIAAREHSDNDFKDLIEILVGKKNQEGLWYSNGMFRKKEGIIKQQTIVRKLIIEIKNNLDQPASIIYDRARTISKKINGLGPNYIGEIMMTYAPEKLANINRNPITVLREEGGVALKSHSQQFNGADYEEYNMIVKEISNALGLSNMLAADYFFNEIYQKLKIKKREKA